MRTSLEEIGKQYKEYMKRMKESFNKKEAQYLRIHEQLSTNNEFICTYANDVQQVLEDHRDAIIDEKNLEWKI